ncbi:MAG: hypothetical protein A2000_05400 [Ignavibacteria bacterium GWB2_36_8]|nr:MAG: hypothetical protein A2000_05400 [Ignavibacteria bacterium GWB2_36_8]OGU48367.1 MAG: hypothetical protein A2080_10535 [Ignavibacteria bacterium GWC2_36_12]
MGFPRFICSFILFLMLLGDTSFSQIIFKELPGYQSDFSDSVFFDLSETREIIPLNGNWRVYSAKDKEVKKTLVSVPSVFKEDAELVFEKTFNLTKEQVAGYRFKIFFLGLSYYADIVVNNIVIYRHRGGAYPFTVDLPRDILNAGKSNILSVKLSYKLDSENTIPVKQRFLFPESYGGIIKDVYLHLVPNISVAETNFKYSIDSKSKKAQLNIDALVENKDFKDATDSLRTPRDFELVVTVYTPDRSSFVKNKKQTFQLNRNEERHFTNSIELSNPLLWSPGSPLSYHIEISLIRGDELIDKVRKDLSIYFLFSGKENLTLNGQPFVFKGTTYAPSFGANGSLAAMSQMEEDIKLISETGFNSVRFVKSVPHPYYLRLCEKYGLLSFIEIPISYIPADLSTNPNFITRSKNYLSEFIKGYKNFWNFTAIGLGGSYIPGLDEHRSLIEALNAVAKKETGLLTYASFTGFDLPFDINVDLYGVEIIGNSLVKDTTGFNSLLEKLGRGRVFISEATYFVNAGNTSGYVNDFSYEAQAKYFEDFLDAFSGDNTTGYFINTIFDYRGDFASFISGYNKNNIYRIGLIDEDRKTDYLSYKVVKSKLQNAEKVTIPIGTKLDKAPMIFIVVGLALALIIGVLVNSGRKFREDISRALLRPYNFFADIRDQRIISSYHSSLMAIVIAVVMGLMISSILYFLRDNIVFEKIVLSFGSIPLTGIMSYLAWNPFITIIWLSIAFCVSLVVLILVIKIASLFIKNRVYLSSIYFAVVWAFLPIVLLIPAGIILYRLLEANVANLYVYIAIIIFALWVFYRLMKGIYVIFDVASGNVYLYSIVMVVSILAAAVLYYEFKNSLVDYLLLTFKQYNIF